MILVKGLLAQIVGAGAQVLTGQARFFIYVPQGRDDANRSLQGFHHSRASALSDILTSTNPTEHYVEIQSVPLPNSVQGHQ